MFGISEENVLEANEGERVQRRDDERGVGLSYNQTTPDLIRDGVDAVTVFEDSDDRYRVEYWGYLAGSLLVSRAGVEELGAALLGDREEIPSWTLDTERDDLPDWIPDDYGDLPPVGCDDCGEDVPVTEVRTPLSDDFPDRLCRDCWTALREL